MFAEEIFRDEEYLFDSRRCYVLVGWEEYILVDGEVLILMYEVL